MATDYLTLDQVCEATGSTQADVKAMVADGRLHEYRDAGKVFFKRAEVQQMAAKEGSSIVDLDVGDEITVEGADENASFASALTSLADSSSSLGLGDLSPAAELAPDQPSELSLLDEPSPAAASGSDSGSAMGLSPLEMNADDFPQELPAAPKPGDKPNKAFTSEIDLLPTGDEEEHAPLPKPAAAAEVPDFGLSGSSIMNLEPGLGEEEAPAPRKSATAASGGKGISVFEDEEVEIAADPMGETRISAGVDELEAVGSGSGLLDLTQVSDDTSLGAELLDVISPTEGAETQAEDGVPMVEAAETVGDEDAVVADTVEEAPIRTASRSPSLPAAAAVGPRMAAYAAVEMPGEVWMNITALLGIIGMIVIGLVTSSALQGVWPSFMTPLAKDVVHYSVFGGLGLLAIVFGLVGILAGRK